MEIEDSESQDQHHDGLCTCILLVQLQIINFKFNIVSFGIIAFIGPDSSIDNTENSMMGSLFEFLKKINKPKKKYKRRNWFQRTQSSIADWEAIRSNLWKALKTRETIDIVCNKCMEREAYIKCHECEHDSLCYVCDNDIHDIQPFHNRMVDGSNLLPLQSFDSEEGITFQGLYNSRF